MVGLTYSTGLVNHEGFYIIILFLFYFTLSQIYDNECRTKENKKQTGLKSFKPKPNLNPDTDILILQLHENRAFDKIAIQGIQEAENISVSPVCRKLHEF